MKIKPSVILAMNVVFACSCATQPSPPITVTDNQYFPQRLEMHYLPSPMFGGRTELTFQDGYLVRRKYARKKDGDAYKNVLAKTEYFVPTEDQWREFWQEMEQLQIWKWKNSYSPSDIGAEVFEGGGWHLLMAYHGRSIDTSGDNAGPMPNSPKKTAIGDDGLDRRLESAILRLVGGQG